MKGAAAGLAGIIALGGINTLAPGEYRHPPPIPPTYSIPASPPPACNEGPIRTQWAEGAIDLSTIEKSVQGTFSLEDIAAIRASLELAPLGPTLSPEEYLSKARSHVELLWQYVPRVFYEPAASPPEVSLHQPIEGFAAFYRENDVRLCGITTDEIGLLAVVAHELVHHNGISNETLAELYSYDLLAAAAEGGSEQARSALMLELDDDLWALSSTYEPHPLPQKMNVISAVLFSPLFYYVFPPQAALFYALNPDEQRPEGPLTHIRSFLGPLAGKD